MRGNARPPSRRRVVDAVASLLRGTDEELEASHTFDELSKRPIEQWPDFLAFRPHLRTESLVARLIAEGRREVQRRPEEALVIFKVAEGVANGIRDPIRLATYRGNLAKERAHALRVLRRYPEALEAVDSAESFLSHVPSSAYELAFVRWARAMIFFDTARYTEALTLAITVVRSFEKFEDIEYAQQARILVADLCREKGDIEDALAMYREALAYFEEQDDEEIVPKLRTRLAACEARLARDSREAETT